MDLAASTSPASSMTLATHFSPHVIVLQMDPRFLPSMHIVQVQFVERALYDDRDGHCSYAFEHLV